MPKIAALGGLSSRGFGEFAQQTAANYIEDVFSTYLYTGNGGAQTINNGIDLSGKGGMVWLKNRSSTSKYTESSNHHIYDTARGVYVRLSSNDADGNFTNFGDGVTSFNSNGFSFSSEFFSNENAINYASWTFRKQPKFFDVITYTGNGANRTISHNLGSVPGMIIIKRTDTTGAWAVYHNALANTEYLILNTTAAKATGATYWNSTTPTSTVFSLGTATDVNANGGTYVAYLYASNAGGFGADGSQNVISCGSFTTDGSGVGSANLGWEPQYILVKRTNGAENWYTFDIMRGWNNSSSDAALNPNLADAEYSRSEGSPNATGFSYTNGFASSTYIYMAIRRGPMRTPTDATKVFSPNVIASANVTSPWTTGFAVDSTWESARNPGTTYVGDRIRGNSQYLDTTSTSAEGNFASSFSFDKNTGTMQQGLYSTSATGLITWNFRRAPGFFDVVCYTGASSTNQRVSHNLGVVPELIITRRRTVATEWFTYHSSFTRAQYIQLESSAAKTTAGVDVWGSSNPTATDFGIASSSLSFNGYTCVAYLFASCPGVSKVGSYTGTGSTQTISCGFTGGARYVLIKRTDSTGDWWAWDTARGMVAGTDPRLAYNSTAAETNANWVYTTTGGFQIVTSDATVNANGGSYIYLAIA